MAVPHLSVHGVVGPGITLGGSLGYGSSSGEFAVRSDGERETGDAAELREFLCGLRGGYLLMPEKAVSLWLRAGVSAFSAHGERDDAETSFDQRGLVLNIDPLLLITPADNVALMLGPVMDIMVTGDREERAATDFGTESEVFEFRTHGTNIGLTAGVALLL